MLMLTSFTTLYGLKRQIYVMGCICLHSFYRFPYIYLLIEGFEASFASHFMVENGDISDHCLLFAVSLGI